MVQTETGGAFGGKEDYPSVIGSHAALLAMKSGRPVKMIYDRMEDLAATSKRHPSRIRHRTAVDKSGKLLAMEIELATDGGAYSTLSSTVLSRATLHSCGPYFCPNVRVRSRAWATNTVPYGAFRGFGAPQATFAVERHMDEIAAAIGMDPIELRRKNFLQDGMTTAESSCASAQSDPFRLRRRSRPCGVRQQRWPARAESAQGTVWHGVCGPGTRAYAHIRTEVRSAGMKRGARQDRGGQRGIGSAVGRQLDLHRQQFAGLVNPPCDA